MFFLIALLLFLLLVNVLGPSAPLRGAGQVCRRPGQADQGCRWVAGIWGSWVSGVPQSAVDPRIRNVLETPFLLRCTEAS